MRLLDSRYDHPCSIRPIYGAHPLFTVSYLLKLLPAKMEHSIYPNGGIVDVEERLTLRNATLE